MERQFTQQFPEVWVKDNQPPRLAKQTPLVIELKPSTIASAPTLGLPDFVKPFTLYVTEKDKVAMGVLSQTGDMGQTRGLSRETTGQCCPRGAGMPKGTCCSCLTGPGGNQADFGPRLDCKVPHEVNTLLRGDPHKWLSTSRISQYQGLLCENPRVTTEPCQALNPSPSCGRRWALT